MSIEVGPKEMVHKCKDKACIGLEVSRNSLNSH